MIRNQIQFKVSGNYALFTDPLTKIGGEKSTLPVPTYQALKGVVEGIYWKPSIYWVIDQLRVLQPIRTESKGIRPINYSSGGNDLAYYTYLRDVSYIVRAHFEFNKNRPDLKEDMNEHKHFFIAKRCIAKGGRRDIFCGTKECQGYVEEVTGDEKGYYDNMGEMELGLMYHSLSYPDENGQEVLNALFWRPKMVNGIIKFCRPEECEKTVFIKNMKAKQFDSNNFSGLEEEGLLEGYEGQGGGA